MKNIGDKEVESLNPLSLYFSVYMFGSQVNSRLVSFE